MENRIKKWSIRAAIAFGLFMLIWVVVCLAVDANSSLGTALIIISMIPCGGYIVYGTKVLHALNVAEFYSKR